MIERKKTKKVWIKQEMAIGGDSPVSIQSMTNTDTANVDDTVAQIQALEQAGCELVRVSVPNIESAEAIRFIKKRISIPLVADIHFDYRLALLSIENGIDKLRINPGNIGSEHKVKEVVTAAKANGVPIRIGVNAGSLKKDILEKYGAPTPEALVESALEHVSILEKQHFDNIIVSVKASDVEKTVETNRLLSKSIDYPLHIGVTEAGIYEKASIRSAVALGTLLFDGIGDTMRVSITGNPVSEIQVAESILQATGLRKERFTIVSCPTCARTGEHDLENIVRELERKLPETASKPLTIAVMGCIVNGPGEASEADLGVAFAGDKAMLFVNGNQKQLLPREEAIDALIYEISNWE